MSLQGHEGNWPFNNIQNNWQLEKALARGIQGDFSEEKRNK